MLSILDSILSGAGYKCTGKVDPNETLALVAARPQVAVVLSDILMPGPTELQFVDRLNAMSLGHAPPRVLLLTAKPTSSGLWMRCVWACATFW
ncbi:MAG TPA: hypothetical protein VG963_17555 [Polyangiaceae bacterium]|nr:hypothetical protein [Polyangiaceae bacterium]